MIYTSLHSHGFEKVLGLLKSHREEYLSGQDLSDVLKISRVAVWKHIKKIRMLGYEVESKQKLGYRLVHLTRRLLPWEVADGLETSRIGRRIYYFDSIDSTQTYATEIASESKDGDVVIAQKQTRGRGRMNRRWVSPDGGIWLSVILRPKSDSSLATMLPFAASVALADAIERILGVNVGLKWPNDILVNRKKAGGILVDVSLTSNQIDYAVIGVGVNFAIQAKRVEQAIKDTSSGVASLDSKNQRPVGLVQEFFKDLECTLDTLGNDGGKDVLYRWVKRSTTIGRNIVLNTTEGRIQGSAVRIDPDGALVIKQRNKIHRVLAGDIVRQSPR